MLQNARVLAVDQSADERSSKPSVARIATRVVEIEEGRARNFIGDYEYYLWKKAQEFESIKESREELEEKTPGKSAGPTRAMAHQIHAKAPAGDRRDLTKTQARLEKQVTKAEADIADSETKVKARELELANPKLYEDLGKWNALHQEQQNWKRDLERLTSRWESLSAELEEVKQKLGALK